MKILFGQKHWCFLLCVIFLFLFYLFIFHRVTLSWRTQGEKPSCCPGWNILILSPSEKHSKVRKKTLLLINCFYLDCKQCDVVFFFVVVFLLFCSWWPSLCGYGVLQWRRPTPEDKATEICTILRQWCK